MGRRFFIWVALVAFLPTLAAAKEKTGDDYWNEIAIKLENVAHFINQDTCYQNQEFFIGCISALNVMADETDEGHVGLYTKEFALSHPQIVEKIISEYPPIVVGQIATEKIPKSAFQKFKEDQKNYAEYVAAFIDLYKSKSKINFNILLQTFDSKIKDRNHVKYIYGHAINMFLVAEDPHAAAIPKEVFQKFNSQPSFGGIGVVLEENPTKVGEFTDDSPAKEAGLKIGDALLKVDGRDLTNLKISEVVGLLRGEINTTVVVTVKRDNSELNYSITRQQIVTKNVISKLVTDMGPTFGFVKMNSFIKGACEEVFNQIGSLRQKANGKLTGLIVDLRGNPGGIVGEGSCLGHLFVGNEKTITTLKSPDGKIRAYQDLTVTTGKPASIIEYLKSIPLAVLVNGRSASASELSSGALQDYKRAWLIGERTYGKGTAQSVIPSENAYIKARYGLPPGLYVKMTMERFYLPSDTSNQIIGLTPEFVVPYKPDATEEERFEKREADEFSNAVKPVTEFRPNLRPEETAAIQKCADAKRAEKIYEGWIANKSRGDYQLVKAQEILSCSISLK